MILLGSESQTESIMPVCSSNSLRELNYHLGIRFTINYSLCCHADFSNESALYLLQ